jgi:hypothetical protein
MFGWFRRDDSGQELTLDRIFAHLTDLEAMIGAMARRRVSTPTQL